MESAARFPPTPLCPRAHRNADPPQPLLRPCAGLPACLHVHRFAGMVAKRLRINEQLHGLSHHLI